MVTRDESRPRPDVGHDTAHPRHDDETPEGRGAVGPRDRDHPVSLGQDPGDEAQRQQPLHDKHRGGHDLDGTHVRSRTEGLDERVATSRDHKHGDDLAGGGRFVERHEDDRRHGDDGDRERHPQCQQGRQAGVERLRFRADELHEALVEAERHDRREQQSEAQAEAEEAEVGRAQLPGHQPEHAEGAELADDFADAQGERSDGEAPRRAARRGCTIHE